MDTTKLRLFAAVAGIVFGLGGVFALAVALAALAMVAGYSLVRDPAGVARHAQRFMLGLL